MIQPKESPDSNTEVNISNISMYEGALGKNTQQQLDKTADVATEIFQSITHQTEETERKDTQYQHPHPKPSEEIVKIATSTILKEDPYDVANRFIELNADEDIKITEEETTEKQPAGNPSSFSATTSTTKKGEAFETESNEQPSEFDTVGVFKPKALVQNSNLVDEEKGNEGKSEIIISNSPSRNLSQGDTINHPSTVIGQREEEPVQVMDEITLAPPSREDLQKIKKNVEEKFIDKNQANKQTPQEAICELLTDVQKLNPGAKVSIKAKLKQDGDRNVLLERYCPNPNVPERMFYSIGIEYTFTIADPTNPDVPLKYVLEKKMYSGSTSPQAAIFSGNNYKDTVIEIVNANQKDYSGTLMAEEETMKALLKEQSFVFHFKNDKNNNPLSLYSIRGFKSELNQKDFFQLNRKSKKSPYVQDLNLVDKNKNKARKLSKYKTEEGEQGKVNEMKRGVILFSDDSEIARHRSFKIIDNALYTRLDSVESVEEYLRNKKTEIQNHYEKLQDIKQSNQMIWNSSTTGEQELKKIQMDSDALKKTGKDAILQPERDILDALKTEQAQLTKDVDNQKIYSDILTKIFKERAETSEQFDDPLQGRDWNQYLKEELDKANIFILPENISVAKNYEEIIQKQNQIIGEKEELLFEHEEKIEKQELLITSKEKEEITEFPQEIKTKLEQLEEKKKQVKEKQKAFNSSLFELHLANQSLDRSLEEMKNLKEEAAKVLKDPNALSVEKTKAKLYRDFYKPSFSLLSFISTPELSWEILQQERDNNQAMLAKLLQGKGVTIQVGNRT